MATIMKDLLRNHPRLYDMAKAGFRSYQRLRRELPVEYEFFRALSSIQRSLSFVQIGASDGMMNDPLREFIVSSGWRGLLIEPIPYCYDRLVYNYRYLRGGQLQFLNAAICLKGEADMDFYTFNEGFLSSKNQAERVNLLQKSSFDKDAFTGNLTELGLRFDDVAAKVHIPSLQMSELVRRYPDFAQSDLLVIDAEGYDEKIIRSVDFELYRPRVIFFETIFSSSVSSFEYLTDKGYSLMQLGTNAAALLDPFLKRNEHHFAHLRSAVQQPPSPLDSGTRSRPVL